jgi:hypothetical protein
MKVLSYTAAMAYSRQWFDARSHVELWLSRPGNITALFKAFDDEDFQFQAREGAHGN